MSDSKNKLYAVEFRSNYLALTEIFDKCRVNGILSFAEVATVYYSSMLIEKYLNNENQKPSYDLIKAISSLVEMALKLLRYDVVNKVNKIEVVECIAISAENLNRVKIKTLEYILQNEKYDMLNLLEQRRSDIEKTKVQPAELSQPDNLLNPTSIEEITDNFNNERNE